MISLIFAQHCVCLTFDPFDLDTVECLELEVADLALPVQHELGLVVGAEVILALRVVAADRQTLKAVNGRTCGRRKNKIICSTVANAVAGTDTTMDNHADTDTGICILMRLRMWIRM